MEAYREKESTRLSASFLLKTMGDLNLRTLLCGPSTCRRILSSLSLDVTCAASCRISNSQHTRRLDKR